MTTTMDGDAPTKVRREVDVDADPIVHMEPRLRARRIEIRRAARRHRRRLVISALSVLVLVGALAGALYSPFLEVHHVSVLGDRHLTAAEVAAASGVRTGDRLIDLDTAAVTRRLARLPWVRSAQVTRQWPDSVELHVVERAAVATVATSGGTRIVITTGGRLAGLAGPFDQGLPLVSLPASVHVAVGTVLPTAVAGAVEMLGALPQDVASRSAGATVTARGDLTVKLTPSGELWFGPAQQVRQKFLSAETILGGAVALNCLKRLDVRIPSAPTVLQSC